LHWINTLTILSLSAFGLYMVELTYYDALYTTLPFIHKSLGMLLIPAFAFNLLWKCIDKKPEPTNGVNALEQRLASLLHWIFYSVIAVILISGYLIPTSDGEVIDVFGLVSVPATITSILQQPDQVGLVHQYLAYALLALVLLHVAAALKHHFINRDNTLGRMLGMSSESRN
jgi:cytochrome b561